MNFDGIRFHVNAYKKQDQILDAANYIIRTFHLQSDNFAGFGFREELDSNSILLTAEGVLGEKQTVKIPKNIFDFDLNLVLNMIAHEMLHVRQKAHGSIVKDKNEREWQAYTEMLFHKEFPQIPDAPDFNRKQFAIKALEYYRRMGENSDLQKKYNHEKIKVETLLDEILIKRGEKEPKRMEDSPQQENIENGNKTGNFVD